MPRKTRIYWISKPTNLSKCHSRRCEKSAQRDRLCAEHWTAWQLTGFKPPMPDVYHGVVEPSEPPLKKALAEKAAVVDDAINLIASIATDDETSPEVLERALADLKAEKEATRTKKRESLAPFVQEHKRTRRWFRPVQVKLDQAIELAEKKLETSRSTMQDLNPNVRRQRRKTAS